LIKSQRLADWCSFHLFYHGDLSKVLQGFVRPTIGRLLAKELSDNFFFIRYLLGGPHVRLRIHTRNDCVERAREILLESAVAFLDRCPSITSLDQDKLREQNRSITAGDPIEREETVYPDNTFLEFPFTPEIERYGGLNLLDHSLNFFALSSVMALHFVATQSEASKARQLSAICRLLVLQAWGFAEDEQEFLTLLASRAGFSTPEDPFLVRGDEVFEKRRDVYHSLLREQVTTVLSQGSWFADAAHRLSREIRPAGTVGRLSIGLSQMHMTANRLGLKNQEEIYLGRLLWRAARDLASTDSGFRDSMRDEFRRRAASEPQSGERLRDLLDPIFRETFTDSLTQILPTLERGIPEAHES
jgi:hypothetical protein